MKRIIGLLVFTLLIGNTYAQNISHSNVPALVLNTFQLKLPNAHDVKWKLEKGNYRVGCKVNGKYNKLILDYKGKLLRHEQDLYLSEIPKSVLETIRSRVAFFDISDADRIEAEGKITYEIDFKIDGKSHNFWIDQTGKLLKFRKDLKHSEVPATILSLINTKYGQLDIGSAKYIEESGKSVYIIKGEINDMDHAFRFDQNGTLLMRSQDLRNSEIPIPVLNAKNSAYGGYEIKDADLVEKGGKPTYILQLRRSKEKVYITFNPNGKILEVK